MRKTVYILLTALALAAAVTPASGARKPRKKAGTEVSKAPAKTPYQKFSGKKGLKSAGEGFKVYRDGQKVWLEIPDSLMGKKVVLSTVTSKTSSEWVPVGRSVSPQKVFVLSRTDSLLVLREPRGPVSVRDTSLHSALRKAGLLPVRYAFPLKYRNADSSAVVVDATRLFSPSNKDAFSMKGVNVDDTFTAYDDGTPVPDFSEVIAPVAYPGSVGVRQAVSFHVTPYIPAGGGRAYVFEGEKERIDGEFITTLTVLPASDLAIRPVDRRIGVRSVPYQEFSAARGIRSGRTARRWNITPDERLTVYVDTLFPEAWYQAIRKGIEAWNPAFEQLGIKRAVDVRRYPSYGGFRAEDPLVSKVMADDDPRRETIRTALFGDNSTGELLSFTMTVPAGFIDASRYEAFYNIADVDARFRTYDLPESALCDMLRARVMQAFGGVLGLEPNYAGSLAYSPAQLRSPSFTKLHGITGSVTDDVLFNIFAREGDREKGLVTIVDRIGPYDKLAVKWLYSALPEGADVQAELRSMLDAHAGKEYLYVPFGGGRNILDPRAVPGDLGSDPEACFDERMRHLKAVMEQAYSWIGEEDIEMTEFRVVFPERVALQMFSAARTLLYHVGGVYNDDAGMTAVPKDFQKHILRKVNDTFTDFSLAPGATDLFHFSGAVRSFDGLFSTNYTNQSGFYTRIPMVAFAADKARSGYPASEYLEDLVQMLTEDIRQGRVSRKDEFPVTLLMAWGLMGNSAMLQSGYNEAFHRSFALTEDLGRDEGLAPVLTGIPAESLRDLDTDCYKAMESLHKILKAAASRERDDVKKGILDYLLNMSESALRLK
ncbi:MAG: zinc-dependent metalloprotease [Bacteroidales bacterium]|nr:zinc-dependent metalloprotease [Bacteroidales bacterium]